MTSGERIKQLRLERNWSQAKLAKEVPIYYLLCTKEPSAAYVMKARSGYFASIRKNA